MSFPLGMEFIPVIAYYVEDNKMHTDSLSEEAVQLGELLSSLALKKIQPEDIDKEARKSPELSIMLWATPKSE